MTIGSFLKKNKINEFLEKNNMILKGDRVVLGLSGGPDSVCLFFVLLALAQEYELEVHALHVNHCIRGKDADEDQEYVESLCKEYEVPLKVVKVDIPALSKESGRGLEEEARMARYAAFEEYAAELDTEGHTAKIAIAHNADDNAETVLFHMARGTGLDGMCGIAAKRGRIIRPLLQVPKAEIMDFINDNQLAYCVDETNSQVEYDRNRIRHNILPELEQINPKTLEHISDMTARLTEVAEYISLEARGLLEIAKEEGDALRKRALMTAPRVIATQALKEYLSRFMPEQKDVSASHIEAILGLLNEDGERQVHLPYKKTLIISYEKLYVIDEDEKSSEKSEPFSDFSYREFNYEQGMKYPVETYTKWFDCDRITDNVVIRTRAEGDYLTIDSAGNHKSIQDYFVDEKIPRHLRDEIPLVCDGNHVMWVVGYRISEYYKISNNTTRVLEITYGGTEHE
ncbi:tRNA(Ile)-lysidine synthase [Pseudobutyrivibrio sp. YE44]|uniref:tRNA lysidine(34) synthetase TilS n=1 Tax=Pseudobutyrivibrio sp. YE44 TaxID=1520802 RepID=UPI00088D1991|nr:tRNA lysidine(34) synthetase TilS [Pseudobutyrivibrio sp. YE44]SDB29926.1 tRNA(Ile)-lysidine synthase [Pseudobutyrivibrio sp. YE44]